MANELIIRNRCKKLVRPIELSSSNDLSNRFPVIQRVINIEKELSNKLSVGMSKLIDNRLELKALKSILLDNLMGGE